jgi:hypothetical protein
MIRSIADAVMLNYQATIDIVQKIQASKVRGFDKASTVSTVSGVTLGKLEAWSEA